MKHVLAHRDGIRMVLGILFAHGAMCPDCGHGTRRTSKRWAACKKCGRTKIPYREIPTPEEKL